MKRSFLILVLALLTILAAGVSVHASHRRDIRLPLVENNVPHIIDAQSERLFESLLQDIVDQDHQTEIRFIAIPNRNIAGTGRLITFEEYRDNILMNFGRDYLNSRFVYVVIWSIDEDILFISVPSEVSERVSQTTIDHIIQTEYKIPTRQAGVPVQTAMFNTLSHLGRYLSVATSVAPRYDQSLVPDGIPYGDFDVYTVPNEVRMPPETQQPEPSSVATNQSNVSQSSGRTSPPARSSANGLLIGIVVGVVVLILIAIIIRRRRNASDYDEDYPDDEIEEPIDAEIEEN